LRRLLELRWDLVGIAGRLSGQRSVSSPRGIDGAIGKIPNLEIKVEGYSRTQRNELLKKRPALKRSAMGEALSER